MPEARLIPLYESVNHWKRMDPPVPMCSLDLREHDWARLVFNEMTMAVRCQTCGREPFDIVAHWRLDQWTNAV